jgi:hypothetical protein
MIDRSQWVGSGNEWRLIVDPHDVNQADVSARRGTIYIKLL